MSDFKDKIRARLADMSGAESDFDALSDIIDQQLNDVSGGFPQFSQHYRFKNTDGQEPIEPGIGGEN
jgi:hypothetical protein